MTSLLSSGRLEPFLPSALLSAPDVVETTSLSASLLALSSSALNLGDKFEKRGVLKKKQIC